MSVRKTIVIISGIIAFCLLSANILLTARDPTSPKTILILCFCTLLACLVAVTLYLVSRGKLHL